MKAFAYQEAHSLENFSIELAEVPEPIVGPLDLLVSVKAFSFNPVDCKIRQSRNGDDGQSVILGWDAAGIVEAMGAGVSGFAVGDEVYYAGDRLRPGSYAELQAVDHRLVARKPASLDFAQAAALPLTALTAFEGLDRGIVDSDDSHVLIIGGAGGVGSMAIQLLKAMNSRTKVIATATRPETIEFAQRMGADYVIGRDLEKELKRIEMPSLDAIFSTTHTQDYLSIIPDLLRPFGHLIVIDDPSPFDIRHFKTKALSVHWEFMFAKSIYGHAVDSQGGILRNIAALVDAGVIKTTCTSRSVANIESLHAAHVALENGTSVGKMVMEW